MKPSYLKISCIVLTSIVILSLGGCKSKKIGEPKYDEITMYCSGAEYSTSKGILRANASGRSYDLEISREKAFTNARNRMSNQLEIFVSNLTDFYKKETDLGKNNNKEKRFEMIIREVAKNKLQGVYPICEKVTKNRENHYISYVALELKGDEFLKAAYNRLSKDDALKVDYDYEKFKKSYEEAMEQLERDQQNH